MNTAAAWRGARVWLTAVCGVSGIVSLTACTGVGVLADRPPEQRWWASSPSFGAKYNTEAIACDHPLASEAGAEMLARGGNAVDAAVAASFALSVVRPYSCGIGGGGFMVVVLAPSARFPDGHRVAIDYRETAPAAVGAEFFEALEPDASQTGGAAVGVPGTVAGLLHALEAYGSLDRAVVMAPAIRLAREGYLADAHTVAAANGVLERVSEDEGGDPHRFGLLRERMLMPADAVRGDTGLRIGDRIRLPEQATVLDEISRHGREAFYAGPIAAALVDAVRADGGVMTLDDLAGYEAIERAPLMFAALGRTFVTMPPPSSGGLAIAQTLGLFERSGGARASGIQRTHLLIEGLKHAFADRAAWGGDPAFVAVPVDRLLSPGYLDGRARTIDPVRTLAPELYDASRFAEGAVPIAAPMNDSGTSHISVVDRFGNAVSCTETINTLYGALLVPESLGFALNDQMDDFAARAGVANAYGLVQSANNAPAPGKRPLSSMSPTVVLDASGRVEAVAGASGGPRIITATLQTLLHALTVGGDQPARDAVARPRVHHQWRPDRIDFEPGGLSPADRAALRSMGHALNERAELGVCQAIVRTADGRWDAASDPRKGGRTAGR